MIQSLDVISVNLWQILISLANLTVIFLIVKKFLFKPVNKMIEKRQAEIDEKYMEADKQREEARLSKEEYENRLKNARAEADEIVSDAAETAKFRGEKILDEAKLKADEIIRRAEAEADLTYKSATDGIKREIVGVSGMLAEKIIQREINSDDHRELIDSFIREIGDGDDGNK